MDHTISHPAPITYVGLLHLTAMPAWLALTRHDRTDFVETRLAPILTRFPTVRVRWIDVEAFSAASSDILLAEFDDPTTWNSFIEELRDTALFALPYFRLNQLLVGIEDGFVHHEKRATGALL